MGTFSNAGKRFYLHKFDNNINNVIFVFVFVNGINSFIFDFNIFSFNSFNIVNSEYNNFFYIFFHNSNSIIGK